jgi:hypothetical protein
MFDAPRALLLSLGVSVTWVALGGAIGRERGSAAQLSTDSSRSVFIDFYAVTSDGQPVEGLRAEEIQLKIDGRPRTLTSVDWVPVAAVPSIDGTGGAAVRSAPPPFGSNAMSDSGRSFVIAIEDDSFRPGRERPLRAAVDRFLAALTSRDRVALVTMPYGGFRLAPTSDFERVRAELAKIGGQGSVNETGSEMACRTRRTIESLAGLASGFGTEGSTTVLFFTSAMAAPRRDAAITMAPGMCELTVDMFAQLGAAAGAGRATFYVIQPEDLVPRPGAQARSLTSTFIGSDNPLEGIEHLAGVTGGTRLQIPATGETTLVRVARETSAYYRITFEPQPNERTGSSRLLDIKVARDGVIVRGRPHITIPKPETRATVKVQSVSPRAMLREARVFRELPLRGVGYVSNNPGDDRLKVICMMEPIDRSVELSAAAAGIYDNAGKLVAQWTAEPANLMTTPVVGALLVPKAGTYRLRAATDVKGRSGSADYDLAAELTPAGPLRVSSLVLGLSRDGGFAPRMLFGVEPVAIGYLDVYGRSDAISVVAEMARSVDGPALGSAVPGALRRVAGEDRAMATVALPIGALPPGDYVVRATITAAGHPAGRVLRTLRKEGVRQ